MQHFVLVSYDISDPVRLRKTHRIVRDFGDALQLSVFICQLRPQDRAMLVGRIREVIHHEQDQVALFDLGTADDDGGIPRCETLGRPADKSSDTIIIV